MCRSTEVAVKQALGAGEVDVQKTRQEVEIVRYEARLRARQLADVPSLAHGYWCRQSNPPSKPVPLHGRLRTVRYHLDRCVGC